MRYTRHHITPRSRVRKSKKTVLLPEKFHDNWHYVFGDLKETELFLFLREVDARMHTQKRITQGELQELREKIKEGSR